MWLSAEFEETFLTLSPKTSQQTRLKRRCCLSDKLIRVWWQNSPSRRRFSVSLWAITQVQRVPVHTPVNINALNLPTCDFWIWCMMNSTSMDGCNHVSVVMWAVCEKWVGVVYTEYDGLVFILLSIEISLFFWLKLSSKRKFNEHVKAMCKNDPQHTWTLTSNIILNKNLWEESDSSSAEMFAGSGLCWPQFYWSTFLY